MYLTLTILIVIASVLLTLIVLVQNSKGGGLSAGFSSSNQVLGVNKTTDVIEKLTWSLTVFIIVLSIFAASMHPSKAVGAGQGIDLFEDVRDVNTNTGTEQSFFDIQEGAEQENDTLN